MRTAIIFDTETTGFPVKGGALEVQPYITEFCAIKINADTMEQIETQSFLLKPLVDIPPKVQEITGITNEMVAELPTFQHHYRKVKNIFEGAEYLLAHNINFDLKLLNYELHRIQKQDDFPWPPNRICTMAIYADKKTLDGKYRKLAAQYKELLNKEFLEAHRAYNDTQALYEVVVAMKTAGLLW